MVYFSIHIESLCGLSFAGKWTFAVWIRVRKPSNEKYTVWQNARTWYHPFFGNHSTAIIDLHQPGGRITKEIHVKSSVG